MLTNVGLYKTTKSKTKIIEVKALAVFWRHHGGFFLRIFFGFFSVIHFVFCLSVGYIH